MILKKFEDDFVEDDFEDEHEVILLICAFVCVSHTQHKKKNFSPLSKWGNFETNFLKNEDVENVEDDEDEDDEDEDDEDDEDEDDENDEDEDDENENDENENVENEKDENVEDDDVENKMMKMKC